MPRNPIHHIRLLSLFLLLSQIAFGQFHKVWEFQLEGNGHYPLSFDINSGVPLRTFQTSDGDFITVSMIENGVRLFPQVIYVYRFDTNGNVIWEYQYESAYEITEDLYDATMDRFDNILLAGKTTTHYSGNFEPIESSNALLLKISPEGQLVWKRESPLPPFNASQRCISVDTDAQGNVYSASTVFTPDGSALAIEKWSTAGDSIWETYLEYSYFASLEVVGNLVVLITPPDTSHIYHFSLNGNLLFESAIPKVTAGQKPVFDKDGNWYNLHPTGKYKIEKRSITGAILWDYHKPTNLPSNVLADETEDAVIDEDGNVFVTGRYYGPHYGDTALYSNCDILTVKLNKDGIYQWEDLYQYTDLRSCQVGKGIQITPDGQVLVTGSQSVRQGGNPYHASDMLILLYDPFGHRIDSVFYDGLSGKHDNGVNVFLSGDAIYLLGWSQQADELYDQVVIKYANPLTVVLPNDNTDGLNIYPNPVSNGFIISCESSVVDVMLYDITGKAILHARNYACGSFYNIDRDIQPGLYMLIVRMPDKIYSKSIIIL